jgi:uncharacterized protein (DUF2126 family)/transglutaminase-like putative cysteine protease
MSISVSLEHRTTYTFDRPTSLGPHLIRLRPAPHCRTPISAYSLRISPADHYVNWQQDPYGNFGARVVFPHSTTELEVVAGLIADLEPINPFDFFVEPYGATYPFSYAPDLAADLAPYLVAVDTEPAAEVAAWFDGLADSHERPTVDFLVGLNAATHGAVGYTTRMEPGVQTPQETLQTSIGSCRDSAWLLVAALRHFGLAARFVSGYLIQLGEQDQEEDSTDLHAWAEVFVPGAGWIGLDPTSALLAGEGHIPLAATPSPMGAAPITGSTGVADVSLAFSNTVTRFRQEPSTSRPYTADQRATINALGADVDRRLVEAGLELTMGGEPTFVLLAEPTAPEWTVTADGGRKRELGGRLAARLADAFAPGGLLQHSQGRWYPGESEPRWQLEVVWRRDGEPLWRHPELLADPVDDPARDDEDKGWARAETFASAVTQTLGLPAGQLQACYEESSDQPVAWALPLTAAWWGPGWASPRWQPPEGRLRLRPGEQPAGQRLPLAELTDDESDYAGEESYLRAGEDLHRVDPSAVVVELHETPSRTALVVEPRDGFVRLFLPPMERGEKYAELAQLLDQVAAETDTAVVLEGYGPPPDPRLVTLCVTPDPGVLEVNLNPAASWTELTAQHERLFRLAAELGLGTETFGFDGQHRGTGGGNHWTLGAAEPANSPLLRRPDLLVSLLTYWQHHPALSYLFAGRFVGPTCQAPRVDEGRPENLYELEIAFAEIERFSNEPADAAAGAAAATARPWLVDRALRHLLTDITGNTHRSEFCIDKLYDPNSTRGRLGLLELRGFEMPPHPDLALVQALLIRAVLTRCADDPYAAPLIRWGSRLHDRYLLPHFVAVDLAQVVADLRAHDIAMHVEWFDPFLQFRFPMIGRSQIDAGAAGVVELELRTAIEPWHVLGQESTSTGTARYVDSSVERLQVRVTGFDADQVLLTCNGAVVPLVSTRTAGEYVAAVRYKAWNPWSALHPSLGIDAPLVFDVVDRANRLSRGGATYHVAHPGGHTYTQPPVNAAEAEARRARRFEARGHTTGMIDTDLLAEQRAWRTYGTDDAPITLDLRHRTPRRWGAERL